VEPNDGAATRGNANGGRASMKTEAGTRLDDASVNDAVTRGDGRALGPDETRDGDVER